MAERLKPARTEEAHPSVLTYEEVVALFSLLMARWPSDQAVVRNGRAAEAGSAPAKTGPQSPRGIIPASS